MTQDRTRQIIITILLIVIALISFFVLSKYMSRPETFGETIQSLDEKKTTVAEMTAAATASSAAITLLPNDIGTPIAEKLVDLSGYFILIFSAIYLEKFLTTVAGYIVFRYVIPIALIIFIMGMFAGLDRLRQFAIRLILFGLIVVILVPTSVAISNLIEQTHEYSIQQTIDDANQAADEINNNNDTENSNVLEQFLERVKGGVTGQLDKFEQILSNFIDSIAVLIVTTCVIPIVVLLIFVFLIRQLFGVVGSSSDDFRRFRDAKNSLVKK